MRGEDGHAKQNKKLIRMKGKATRGFSASGEYRGVEAGFVCPQIRQAAVFVAPRRGAAFPGEWEWGDFRVRSQHSCVHV